MQSSASRLFALPMPIHSEHFFCLSAQALAFPLPLCWVHIISAPPLLNAHLVFAVSVRVFVYPCFCVSVSLCISAAAPRNPLHRLRSSYRCQSLPLPILSPPPVSSPRRRYPSQDLSLLHHRSPLLRNAVACRLDTILGLCLSSLCRSWRRLCRSIPATSLPLRCPSSLCLRASVLVHASPQPCVSDLIPAIAVHIPAAAALRSSMPSPCICSLCLSFSARLSPLHCRRFALHTGPSLRRRWADLFHAAASLVFASALPRWSLPLLFGSILCRCTSRSCSLPLRR